MCIRDRLYPNDSTDDGKKLRFKQQYFFTSASLQDITYVGNLIRSRTYEAFFPLISVAAIYLVIVLILTYFCLLYTSTMRVNYNRRLAENIAAYKVSGFSADTR